MNEMEGKRVIVVGLADERSIAYAIAKKIVENGHRIAIGYQARNEGEVKKLLPKLGNPIACAIDVTDGNSLDSFYSLIAKEWGCVDAVIHSIAFAKKEHLRGRFIDVDKAGWEVASEISAFSFVDMLRRTEPLMKNGGSCITISFLGAQRVFPNYNMMGVAKAALESSVRYAANDLGAKNIRVNAISCAPIPTAAAGGVAKFENILLDYHEKSPLKSPITQQDVASAALFLMSDCAKGITGQTIYVDNGYHIMG